MSKAEGLVGALIARPEAGRLVAGRGRYTDDIAAHAGHVAFLRSPYAHATVGAIDVTAATVAWRHCDCHRRDLGHGVQALANQACGPAEPYLSAAISARAR